MFKFTSDMYRLYTDLPVGDLTKFARSLRVHNIMNNEILNTIITEGPYYRITEDELNKLFIYVRSFFEEIPNPIITYSLFQDNSSFEITSRFKETDELPIHKLIQYCKLNDSLVVNYLYCNDEFMISVSVYFYGSLFTSIRFIDRTGALDSNSNKVFNSFLLESVNIE